MADQMSLYVAEDDEVGLRPMRYEDCASYVTWRNAEHVKRFYIYREPITLPAEQAYYREKIAPGTVRVYMICLKKEGGRAVGCAVLNAPEEDGSREYGLFIGDTHIRNIGIGQRVTRLTTDYALTELHIPYVRARVFTDNLRSVRSAESGGLIITGTIRGVVCSDGEVRDMYAFEKHVPSSGESPSSGEE